MKKTFSVFVIILIVAATAVVGYRTYKNYSAKPQTLVVSTMSPSPSSDPTVNWKTYTNTKYNYSIKYPSDLPPVWGRLAFDGHETSEEKNVNTTDNMNLGDVMNPLIGVVVTPTTISIVEETNTLNSYGNGSKLSPKIFNGLPAYYSNDNGNQHYIFVVNRYSYHIYASAVNQGLADQMLSTFKLTK